MSVPRTSDEVLSGLRELDSPTVFNAMVRVLGLPNIDYMDHTIRSLLPELGVVAGYAVTAELTTNDPDSPALPFSDYYDVIDQLNAPLFVVLKDVDSLPGRGASFGDNMAALHKRLGVVGVAVEGTVRDLPGIRQVGLPIWAWGLVPGHGRFVPARISTPVTVGQLRVSPGDLMLADENGIVKVPVQQAPEILEAARQVRAEEAESFARFSDPNIPYAELRERQGWASRK